MSRLHGENFHWDLTLQRCQNPWLIFIPLLLLFRMRWEFGLSTFELSGTQTHLYVPLSLSCRNPLPALTPRFVPNSNSERNDFGFTWLELGSIRSGQVWGFGVFIAPDQNSGSAPGKDQSITPSFFPIFFFFFFFLETKMKFSFQKNEVQNWTRTPGMEVRRHKKWHCKITSDYELFSCQILLQDIFWTSSLHVTDPGDQKTHPLTWSKNASKSCFFVALSQKK